MKDFLFSVIIPVYNVEAYLEETVESVIHQSIGFENIQLILVNDGSPDNSGAICQRYADRYPENVIYIIQENQGVSAARNNGLARATGRYINFLDSDDYWAADAFEKAKAFFDANPQVPVLACRIAFFEAQTGFSHALDYKFDASRVLDIMVDYQHPQLSAASAFFKSEEIRKYPFDASVKYSEDVIVVNQLLLEHGCYGQSRDIVYYYRRRHAQNSAIQTRASDIAYYSDVPRQVYQALMDLSKEKYGSVLPYVQFLVMYDLQWRLKGKKADWLSREEQEKYKGILCSLLREIDDSIILKSRNLSVLYKIAVLNLKYGRNITGEAVFDANSKKMVFRGNTIYKLERKKAITVNILEEENGMLHLEGTTELSIFGSRCEFWIENDKHQVFRPERYEWVHKKQFLFDGSQVYDGSAFRADLPLADTKWYRVVICVDGGKPFAVTPAFGKFGKLTTGNEHSYYQSGVYILQYRGEKLHILKNSFLWHAKKELLYDCSLVHRFWKEPEGSRGIVSILAYRTAAFFTRRFKRKETWLVTDRTYAAGDNGEAFFRYASCQQDAKVYFALYADSADYARVKQYGRVLPLNSVRYRLKFLCCDKLISSQADVWLLNPFQEDKQYVQDLYTFRFAFLQHGITKDDISSWLHRQNKNIQLFVTACPGEYASIIEGTYGYSDRQVKLVGFPRFDALHNAPDGIVAFMPTWRKAISTPANGSSERPYSEAVKNSAYCRFYNRLTADPRILEAMTSHNLTGKFYLHPAFMNQAQDFTGNDIIQVIPGNADYNHAFRESMLLITDYSSVAFDFAYMKKPVVYTQFDRDDFFANHNYKEGYFSCDEDGFGPVCDDYESAVAAIVNYIENDCVMEEKYRNRVDSFFAFTDRENCARVYQAILEM